MLIAMIYKFVNVLFKGKKEKSIVKEIKGLQLVDNPKYSKEIELRVSTNRVEEFLDKLEFIRNLSLNAIIDLTVDKYIMSTFDWYVLPDDRRIRNVVKHNFKLKEHLINLHSYEDELNMEYDRTGDFEIYKRILEIQHLQDYTFNILKEMEDLQ